MRSLWDRADRAHRRLEKRLLRKLDERVQRAVPSVYHGRTDWHDRSVEFYGCDPDFRITDEQAKRIFSLGVAVIYLNADQQETVYSWSRSSPTVRPTKCDAYRDNEHYHPPFDWKPMAPTLKRAA